MKKIFLIDHDICYLSSMESKLRSHNQTVIINDSLYGAEYIFNEIAEKQPHIIVTDILFPKFNGIDLIHQFQADDLTNHIPVIVYTSKQNKHLREKIESKGVRYILFKEDFSPHGLIDRLMKVFVF